MTHSLAAATQIPSPSPSPSPSSDSGDASIRCKLGLIGVGLMGQGIAYNLLRHGHALTLLDHPGNQPLAELLELGAQRVATPAAVAAASSVLLLCVTGSPQVASVLQGPEGVLAGLRPGTVVVDCSTALPEATREMAALVQAAGGAWLDAPMTRTAAHARAGRLNLLVGGEPEVLQQVQPLLACFAEHIVHVGGVGAGQQMKLLHNFVSLGSAVLLAEAAACAQRMGVDAQRLVEVLEQGGGAGVALQRLKPYVLAQDPSGLPFSLANASKDLDYYRQMAQAVGAQSAMAAAAAADVAAGLDQGRPGQWLPELIGLLARDA
jgi:3-hydroxyisobutyrate dehydrogenase-like beta-hydroxyacid dehydrogenase